MKGKAIYCCINYSISWIFEMDFYFLNDSGITGNRGCIKCIYDTVTLELSGHPDRKFSICEMGYFKRWWLQATEEQKHNFTILVNNSQIEFVGGGFSSNDEATAHFEDIITNFELGHEFL